MPLRLPRSRTCQKPDLNSSWQCFDETMGKASVISQAGDRPTTRLVFKSGIGAPPPHGMSSPKETPDLGAGCGKPSGNLTVRRAGSPTLSYGLSGGSTTTVSDVRGPAIGPTGTVASETGRGAFRVAPPADAYLTLKRS